ncbi:MAG: DUF4965 domain-containing protein [Oscillospiraceae bacterium]|nr:DUF4965 domain-containing protein [Oscillospiraceae bacterium]
MNKFRAPAVPLVTVDPYFNIWSAADNLYDDFTRHWTGQRSAMLGMIKIDGVWHRFMGKVEPQGELYYAEPPVLPQKSVEIFPLTTSYIFGNEKITLTLDFTSTLLLNDLYLLSRPFSYIDYKTESADGAEHEIEIYFDISAEACVDRSYQSVKFGRFAGSGVGSVFCENTEQRVLNKSGDDHRIDWGSLHLTAPDADLFAIDAWGKRDYIAGREWRNLAENENKSYEVRSRYPSLACAQSGKSGMFGFVVLGYDDVKCIEYFGKQLDAYWKKDGETFETAMKKALLDHDEVIEKCKKFNAELQEKARGINDKYCDIVSLAYRQTIAAHKLTFDPDSGEILFFSKENFSNGCMATVDVTYPSTPLYLIYNPELVEGMLNPVFKYAAMEQWEYEYAPHDVGQYPLANGQMYGYDRKLRDMQHKYQMPVEECGNMLLCAANVCHAKKSIEYAKKHEKLLSQWANYLIGCGWDPVNQLCTDDFAGHLARNCNLSIKAILGIAAWGKMLEFMGKAEEGEKYTKKAREFAAEWKKSAEYSDHYKLAFDRDDSWSIKYNLVWDKLLGLNIFDADIAEKEVDYYKTKINAYGLPLDVRSDYTKSDWQMWSTVLTNDMDYTNLIVSAMWKFLNETPDRVAFTDWYFTSEPKHRGFVNRSVQGGLFINLMDF